MKFEVKNVSRREDVLMSYIKPSPIRSQDVVLFYDLSAFIPNNPIPAVAFINSKTRSFSRISELINRSLFSEIELTDQFIYDRETKIDLPLWYKHKIKSPVFNRTKKRETYRRKNLFGTMEILNITTDDKLIIVNSEVVKIINPETLVETITNNYYINYEKKSITLNFNTTSNIVIEFDTVSPNIQITQSDRSKYKILYEEQNPLEYVCTIYTESIRPLLVSYYKLNNNNSIEVAESTNPEVIWNRIDEKYILNSNNDNKKVYALSPTTNNNSIVLVSNDVNNENFFKNFAFRSKENVYTKLFLRSPINKNSQSIWNAIIHGSGFISKTTLNNKQEILYINPIELNNKGKIIKISEIVENIDSETVKLQKEPLWEINRKGDILGIELINENLGNPILIDTINTRNKVIKTKSKIGKDTKILANYRSLDNESVVANNLNAIIEPDIYNYYYLYYIIPNNYLKKDKQSIYVHRINRFEDNIKKIYNINDFLNYFYLNQLFILEEIKDNINTNLEDVISFPLSIFYIENPVDNNYIEPMDARVRGGGFREEKEYTYDFCFWNGEMVDLSGILKIYIKKDIKEKLKKRFLEWDERCYNSLEPNSVAENLTEEWIHKIIKKHTRIGFRYEMVYEE